MSQKSIFILNGHPGETTLSRSLAETYAKAARAAGHTVRVTHLSELDFDPDFGSGTYSNHKPLEPDLEVVKDNLEWSQHLVIFAPLWWGGLPAMLKGLFDRVLLAGHAFDTRNTQWNGMPKPLLTGRSARVVLTSDTPAWVERLFYRNAILWQMRGQILGFIGFSPARFTWLSGASHPKPGLVEKWFSRITRIGKAGA